MRNLLLRGGNCEQRTERVSWLLLRTTFVSKLVSSQISIGLVIPIWDPGNFAQSLSQFQWARRALVPFTGLGEKLLGLSRG